MINNALELLRKEPTFEWYPYVIKNKEIIILNIKKSNIPIKIGQDLYIMKGTQSTKKKFSKPQKDNVDIVIVCALVKEAKNAKQVFEKFFGQQFKEFEDDNNDIHYFAIVEDLSILITWSPKMGLEKIRDAVEKVVKKYRPSYVVMTGICAGNENETSMGDVIIASKTIPYGRGSDENEGFKPETSTSELSDPLKRKIDTIEINDILGIFTLEHPINDNQPKLYVAPMASVYTVKKDGKIFNDVLKIDRKVKAVDMEMAGFYEKMRTIRDEAIVKKTDLIDVE